MPTFPHSETLTAEQFACGMGEVLKHGLIKNASYYEWCINQMFEIQDREVEALKTMVLERHEDQKSCCGEEDPTEKGERALLNLGHTVGHAIEKLQNFQMLHGQCVALGYLLRRLYFLEERSSHQRRVFRDPRYERRV